MRQIWIHYEIFKCVNNYSHFKLNSVCTIKKTSTQNEPYLYLSELWWSKQLEAKDKGNCTHPRERKPQLRVVLPSKKNSPLETAQSYTQLLTVSTRVIGFTPHSRSQWHCALPALPRDKVIKEERVKGNWTVLG